MDKQSTEVIYISGGSKVRRTDREIVEYKQILEIIEKCDCCRIGFYDGHEVYIVPLNFGYEFKEDKLILYFHGAKEGRKIDLIRKVVSVGFEMDTNYKLHKSDTACSHSARFDSIIGNGTISMIESITERKFALEKLMLKATHKVDWSFTEEMLNSVCIFKIEVTKLSCKRHI